MTSFVAGGLSGGPYTIVEPDITEPYTPTPSPNQLCPSTVLKSFILPSESTAVVGYTTFEIHKFDS